MFKFLVFTLACMAIYFCGLGFLVTARDLGIMAPAPLHHR